MDLVKMQNWKRALLVSFAFGAGFAVTAAVIIGATIWYTSQPAPWNTRAITATYDTVYTEGEKNSLVFSYTLTNNTGKDWRIEDHDKVIIFATLKDEGRLSGQETSDLLSVDKPLFVPPGHKVRFPVHLKGATPHKLKDNPPTNERKEYRARVASYVSKDLSNLDGFVIFDEKNRYQISLPAGWKDTLKHEGSP